MEGDIEPYDFEDPQNWDENLTNTLENTNIEFINENKLKNVSFHLMEEINFLDEYCIMVPYYIDN